MPEQLEESFATAATFLNSFELAYDRDWNMTKSCMEGSEYLIPAAGSFVPPWLDDESDNWVNRRALLEDYRELRNCMLRIRCSVNFSQIR